MTATNPRRLVAALRAAGWTTVGRRTDVYERLAWPAPGGTPGHPRDRRSLLVPLDPSDGGFSEMMAAVLTELGEAVALGRAAQQVLSAYLDEGDDR